MEVVIGGALALLDLKAQAGVEGLLARAADPEVTQPGLAHLDHALFQSARANHDAIDLQAAIGRQRLVATEDLLQGQRGQTVVLETFGPVRHATALRKTGRGRKTGLCFYFTSPHAQSEGTNNAVRYTSAPAGPSLSSASRASRCLSF